MQDEKIKDPQITHIVKTANKEKVKIKNLEKLLIFCKNDNKKHNI